MKRFQKIVLLVPILLGSLVLPAAEPQTGKGVKSVILFIADGMGIGQMTLARWANGGAPLAMDEWTCGLVRTYSAQAPITDSAAAATAYATGYKTENGAVGIMPRAASMWGLEPKKQSDANRRPLATLLEAARMQGKGTGLVVTCEITHATPAAFSAHQISRNSTDAIFLQQLHGRIDVVLGGGRELLGLSSQDPGQNHLEFLKKRGYTVAITREQMMAAAGNKLWGMFAEKDLGYEIDRTSVEPSLEEMTQKALSLLGRNPQGFFLMVEGSKIDWASHDREPVGVVSEVLSLDRALRAAIDFARAKGDVAVLLVSDHGSGGLSFGDSSPLSTSGLAPLEAFLAPLRRARCTAEGLEKILAGQSSLEEKKVSELVEQQYGLTLSPSDIGRVKGYMASRKPGTYQLGEILGTLMSAACHLGWTTTGHVGDDIPLHVYHPRGYRPSGLVQNTDIARYIAEILGLDLEAWNRRLFLPAASAFAAVGAQTSIEESTVGPVLVASRGKRRVRFPANRDLAEVDGRTVELRSLVVHQGDAFFVPREAVDLLKADRASPRPDPGGKGK